MSARRRPDREAGFTLLEVMMALTVLAIGMLGIVALQAATVGSTQDASQFTTANTIARTWLHRLQKDAQRWNHPSKYKPSFDDINETAWLQNADTNSNKWFLPAESALEPGASAAFDRSGEDISSKDTVRYPNAIYCTHVRLRRVGADLLKAEVRVFWKKRRLGDGALFATYGLKNGICDPAGVPDTLGVDNVNFHWAYTVAGIPRARAQ